MASGVFAHMHPVVSCAHADRHRPLAIGVRETPPREPFPVPCSLGLTNEGRGRDPGDTGTRPAQALDTYLTMASLALGRTWSPSSVPRSIPEDNARDVQVILQGAGRAV